jgi:hypothetical protein
VELEELGYADTDERGEEVPEDGVAWLAEGGADGVEA